MKILNLTGMLSLQSGSLFAKYKDEEILTISPMEDEKLENSDFIKCEIGSLSYVLAMICQKACKNEYFDSLDTGFLSGESNVGEEEIDMIAEFIKECELVIVDENSLFNHPDMKNITSFLAILAQEYKFKIVNLYGKSLNLKAEKFEALKELESFDGTIIFKHNKNRSLKGGKYFAMIAKIKDGDKVNIKTHSLDITRTFVLDENMKGTIAFLGVDEVEGYNYEVAKIIKV